MPTRRAKPDASALRMATQLVDALTADWNPEQSHDTLTEDLRRRIEAKDAGGPVATEEEEPPEPKVLDLMKALEASVAAAKGKRTSGSKPASKRRRTPKSA